MTNRDNKDIKILNRILKMPSTIEEFVGNYYNTLIEDLNTMLRRMSLTRNFDSELIEAIEIPASSTVRVDHRLKIIPAYKITVKQTGAVIITDGSFTKNYIELTNNGGSLATLSIILFKE